MDKTVLVTMGECTRPVSFSTSSTEAITDSEALIQAVQNVFRDILQPGQEFRLQLKSEKWRGEFLDLLDRQEIVDQSIVRAVTKPVREVSQPAVWASSTSSCYICMPYMYVYIETGAHSYIHAYQIKAHTINYWDFQAM